jgi:hypothetical protein
MITNATLDPWLAQFCHDMAKLFGDTVDFTVGNEFPEKEFHYRVRDALRAGDPRVRVLVNRNSDSPGEYRNMKIKQNEFAGISFHGWKDMPFVDKAWWNPADAVDPNEPNTHRKLLHSPDWADPVKIVACTDGARNGQPDPEHAYDWPELFDAATIAIEAGAGYDHQSARKMSLASYGTHDLKCVTEDEFLRKIAAL